MRTGAPNSLCSRSVVADRDIPICLTAFSPPPEMGSIARVATSPPPRVRAGSDEATGTEAPGTVRSCAARSSTRSPPPEMDCISREATSPPPRRGPVSLGTMRSLPPDPSQFNARELLCLVETEGLRAEPAGIPKGAGGVSGRVGRGERDGEI